MASNYTGNYKLCQWEDTDQVKRTEFNEDNAKIDAALGSLASAVSGKASSSAVSSLQSSLNSLKTTVSQQMAALSGKGDCQSYVTTYTGTGLKGEINKNSLSFPKKPIMVFIVGPDGEHIILIQGQGIHYSQRLGSSGGAMFLTWSGNGLQWYAQSSVQAQLNEDGKTYRVLALLQAG